MFSPLKDQMGAPTRGYVITLARVLVCVAALAAGSILGCGGGGGSSHTQASSGSGSSTSATPTVQFSLANSGGVIQATPSGGASQTCAQIGSVCSVQVAAGTSITFVAIPDSGYSFGSWTGLCQQIQSSTCTIVAGSGGGSVSVSFVTAAQVSLTVNGAGNDLVTSTSSQPGSPGNLACKPGASGVCTATFPVGTRLTLTASADPTQQFNGYSGGGCSTFVSCSIVLSGNVNVTANFAALAAGNTSLSVSVSGSGTVSSLPAGITSCAAASGTCTASFANGAGVTLTAVPSAGYAFASWGGVCAAQANPCNFNKANAPQQASAIFSPSAGGPTPIVLYTDIQSGPTSGGENNQGIYLSIFGKNFGSSGLGTTTKVLIGGYEVANYRYLGASRGRPDVQQITVQVGSLANAAPFIALPISVVVNGVASVDNPYYAAQTFTPAPGNIFFVDPVAGVDTNGTTTGGTFTSPFQHVQLPGIGLSFSIDPASQSGAYGRVRAGDFIVLRGGSYTGATGFGGYFMQTLNKSGCPLQSNCANGGGTTSGPITVMGYPTESAVISVPNTGNYGAANGGISSADNARQQLGMGSYWNFSNLIVDVGFADGPINAQRGDLNPNGAYWRVVNNDLSMTTCNLPLNNGECLAGTVGGGGAGHFWVGNHGHDVYDGPNNGSSNLQDHGVYVGYNGPIEIAYNYFTNIYGGNGIQLHNTVSTTHISGISIHHNLIDTVNKHGINLADGSGSNIQVFNNIVMHPAQAGLRMGGTSFISGLKVYNNTFFDTGTGGNNPSSGSLTNDMASAAGQYDIENNILYPHSGSSYAAGSGNSAFVGSGTVQNNLLYNGSNSPPFSFTVNAVQANPLFVSTVTGAEDLHLQGTSPAIGAGANLSGTVLDDFDTATSTAAPDTRGASFSIGAFQ